MTPNVFWKTVEFGIFENAVNDELLCSIRWRPTTPELLPSPFGWRSLAEPRSSALELMAPADTTTMSAVYSSCVPSRSTTTFSTLRPSALVTSRRTQAWVRSVTFGYWSAGSTHTTCASALACDEHANPSQVSQRMHGLCSGLVFVDHDPQRQLEGSQPRGLEVVRELLDPRFVADGRVRIRTGRGRLEGVGAALAVHW